MSDDVETNEKTGDGEDKPARKPLSLRKTETGAVKQSFSHGRSKTVVVETKRRRVLSPKQPSEKPAPEKKAPVAKKAPAKKAVAKKAPETKAASTGKNAAGAVLRTLSEDEKQARAVALAAARKNQEEKRQADEAARKEREAREAEERIKLEAERKRQAAEDAKRAKESEERRKAEEAAAALLEQEERERKERAAAKAKGKETAPAKSAPTAKEDADNPLAQLGGRLKTRRRDGGDRNDRDSKAKEAPRRRAGKLTIANALEDDDRQRSLASVKRAREREKLARQKRGDINKVAREVVIPEVITVQELAQRMAMRAVDLVKELMKLGQMVTANATIDADTAQLVAEDLGHSVKRVSEADVEEGLFGDADSDAELKSRPPVVTIMGHVDHGKTSLLDALRQTDVVAGEAGGITQHIGAYQVEVGDDKKKVTFLDTPGHAAFTQMRARGAKVTDIVIIVVAADDSIMPQTVEAISHAKAAEVPIIVAINKIDKPDANPDKVRTDLLQHEIQVESLGGEVQDVEVSALQKKGLDGVLEAVLLQAELLDLKANPDRAAEGSVVEARLDKGRGAVTTFLVGRGTLKRGDIVVVGSEWGKIRALTDDKGATVKGAIPATVSYTHLTLPTICSV